MIPCIETTQLSHSFPGGEAALESIDLRVPESSIFGLLGPNGAGKSTLLRLLLGLIRPRHGAVSIFGRAMRTQRIDILRQIGSLIESPSVYEHLTARENLALLRGIYRVPQGWIDDALHLVGLEATGAKKVAHFSLGMKQRLGIAVALLHRPRLLILDEPTNGLDPQGMIEMRELIKRLHRERGTTILISSHVLAEMEKLVTHVGVIARGRLRFQGTLDALYEQCGADVALSLRTDDNARALRLLAGEVPNARCCADMILLPDASPERVAAINRQLVLSGIGVHALEPAGRRDLETIFMRLVA